MQLCRVEAAVDMILGICVLQVITLPFADGSSVPSDNSHSIGGTNPPRNTEHTSNRWSDLRERFDADREHARVAHGGNSSFRK